MPTLYRDEESMKCGKIITENFKMEMLVLKKVRNSSF